MSTKAGASTTLDLQAQYNDHIHERDKAIDHIERKTSGLEDNRPSYDDLFKENVKLKLELKESQQELVTLKRVLNLMQKRDTGPSLDDLIAKVTQEEKQKSEAGNDRKKEFVLPPRSVGRSGAQSRNASAVASPALAADAGTDDLDKSVKSPSNPFASENSSDEIAVNKSNSTNSEDAVIGTAQVVNLHEPAPSVTQSPTRVNASALPLQHSSHLAPSQTPALTSPAASVTYTTSRITIKSPNRKQKSPGPATERLNSPQSVNRVTSVINNHLHSPLKTAFSDRDMDIGRAASSSPAQFSRIDSNMEEDDDQLPQPQKQSEKKSVDFSPNAAAKLNNFSQLLADSFGDDHDELSSPFPEERPQLGANAPGMTSGTAPGKDLNRPLPPAPPNFFSPPNALIPETPVDVKLGSPVILNRPKEVNNGTPQGTQMRVSSTGDKQSSNVSSSLAATNNNLGGALSNPATRMPSGTDSTSTENNRTASLKKSPSSASSQNLLKVDSSRSGRPRGNSLGTVTSSAASTAVSDIPLFVQPEELGTIVMDILSTLYHDPQSDYGENLVLFGVIDRSSGKEMFKFSKPIQKIRELDVYLKSHVADVSLPSLPDRQLFQSVYPTKVDYRREHLKNYFNSISAVPELPSNVSMKICQFLSTDTVMTPFLDGDTIKEGSLLMRRPKKALSTNVSWKIRYGILNGEFLQLLENGDMMETIRLRHTSLELLPNLPEDKYGTKNGFLLTEQKKSGLSTTSKYFICSESAKERESWIAALSEFIDTAKLSMASPAAESVGTFNSSHGTAGNESSDQIYVTDLSQPDATSSQSSQTNSVDKLQSTSYEQFSNNDDDERDMKRNKMRSLFPFKKFGSMTNNTLHPGGHAPAHHNPVGRSPTTNDDYDKSMNSEVDRSMRSDVSPTKVSPMSARASTPYQGAVFGASLDKCLVLSSHSYQGIYEIPSIVYRCLEYLYKNRGIQEEGIFRLSGSSTLIKTLQDEFDRKYDVDLCNYEPANDNPGNIIGVNTITGLLKLYLRSLPHLIVGDEQFLLFKKAADDHHDDPQAIAIAFKKIIQDKQVPHANVSIMYALFELLTRINENSKINKMNLRNLCIVFSPTLNIPIAMLQPFIVDFNCIFKDGQPVSNSDREDIDIHIPGV